MSATIRNRQDYGADRIGDSFVILADERGNVIGQRYVTPTTTIASINLFRAYNLLFDGQSVACNVGLQPGGVFR